MKIVRRLERHRVAVKGLRALHLVVAGHRPARHVIGVVCVNRIASTRRTLRASACARRSVEVSTRIERTAPANADGADAAYAGSSGAGSSIRIDGRVR
jgi:hypothetical protein